jgi:lysophospholipase L1-like esterase
VTEPPRRASALESVVRILLTAVATVAVLASLLTYPEGVPWLAGLWLLAYALLTARSRRGTLVLAGLLAVGLVKRVDASPATLLLGVLLAGTVGLETAYTLRRRPAPWPWLRVLLLAVAWLLLVVEASRTGHTSRRLPLDPERPIVCLGDSLSANGYPLELARIVRVPVLDLSAPGVSARQTLKLLPRVREARPQVLVIELGGHEFLHGDSRADAKARLLEIIGAGRDAGAEIVLFEIPRGFIVDAYAGLERQLARENDLELIPDGAIRSLVLFSQDGLLAPFTSAPPLSDDGLHPNANGHRFLCEHVARALRRLYGDAIFK